MKLADKFNADGDFLFRYRGQIPLILFLIAVPVCYVTDYNEYPHSLQNILFWLSIAISICGFIIRSIVIALTPKGTSGGNRKKQVAESLNTTGIYSIVRHPLYLCNFLIWAGITLFLMNIWFFVIVCLLFWLYYERIMYTEEQFLEQKFGNKFNEWCKTVPAFFPNLRLYKADNETFSVKRVLKREYSTLLSTIAAFVYVGLIKDMIHLTPFHFKWPYLYLVLTAICIALILRTIKHHTRLLKE
ncbi:MAG: isoprenylcysteine carboxylmethyltransferase family protein [Flavobacteriales bacterium]